jgi:single-stranded DNA-binding protein
MVTKFTIAARQPKIRGEDQPALWFTVEVWGAPGEWIANNMHKGDSACVTGELCLRQWTNNATGQPAEALTIRYPRVEKLGQREPFGDKPPAQGGDFAAAAARPAPAAAAPAPATAPVVRAAAPAYQQAPGFAPHPVAAAPAAAAPLDGPPY